MELFILSLVLFFSVYYTFGVLNIIVNYVNPRPRHGSKQYQLLPGSRGWPMIGETLEYLRTAKNGVPEKFITDRRDKYSSSSSSSSSSKLKVFKTSLVGEDMAVLCSAAGNKFLFSNENKLVKTWWPASMAKIFPYSASDDHKTSTTENNHHLLKLLTPHLKPHALRKYIGIMDEVTKHHLDTFWDHKGQVTLLPLSKHFTLTLACRLFLNIKDPNVVAKLEDPIRQISSGFISLPIDVPGTRFNRAVKASQQITKEIQNMVAQRRIQLHDHLINHNYKDHEIDQGDIMSSLLMDTYTDGQQMKDSDMANKLSVVIFGAFDSISTAMLSIVMYLSELPQVYDAVLKEQMEIANSKVAGELLKWEDVQKMKYSWSVACEVLRLLPPVMGTFREAITDFVYEGYLIPKGMKLHWNVYATHKDPEYFPNPEEFNPSRYEGAGPAPYSYVPFGGGPRMCPGNEYARVNLLVFMHNAVTRYKWEKVFPDEKFIIDPILLPTKGLPIRLYPHHHNAGLKTN